MAKKAVEKNLVIVESPTKAVAIQKFLGSKYKVIASGGHVRDLPKSQLGIDVENGTFEPKYITIRGKGELLAELRKEVKRAKKIYLATDPDREGEAISWHLKNVLNLNENKNVFRIAFNEVTQAAVKSAIANAREIDMDLVDAQQARRVLDRLVGYTISPLLWSKVKSGTSAGRVQSVVLKMIADREKQIEGFVPVESWTVSVNLKSNASKKPFMANVVLKGDSKLELAVKEDADKTVKELENAEFEVEDVKKSSRTKNSPLPFTTSTLQQEASKALGFSTSKCMSVAQQLYEGVTIKKLGTIGLITYLRTDSTRISDSAAERAAEYIRNNLGDEYSATTKKEAKSGKKIQDAHEAIRPTMIDLVPANVKADLTNDQFKLYQLIWRRFMASQMTAAKYDNAQVSIKAEDYTLRTTTSKVSFDGYLKVYEEADSNEKTAKNLFIPEVGEKLELKEIIPEQHFTQPEPHFTEASLVKTMEELGIGRPSTYAPTIGVLLGRHYILREKKNLYITEIGTAVNSIMEQYFTSIVDVTFTSNMELLLDGVEEGNINWKTIVRNFYPDLDIAVSHASEELSKIELHDEVTDVPCEKCGAFMVIKLGPHGKFLGCPNFPECRNTKPYFEKTDINCPKCGAMLLIRKTKTGRRYFGCEKYPECDFMSWTKPVVTGEKVGE
jgi:DNA topoisomerase-1